MDILIKKDAEGKSSVSLDELKGLIEIASLNKAYRLLKGSIDEIKKSPTLTKDDIISFLQKELSTLVKVGNIINISQPVSIEKNDRVRIGGIYYNKSKGLRLKTHEGWKNIKLE